MSDWRLAACVVLLRPGRDGYEVYLVRRAETLSFLGGFDVFPGGGCDPTDGTLPLDDDNTDAALRACALRELFEEVGVLAADGAQRLGSHELAELRRAILAEPTSLVRLLRERQLTLSGRALVPMGRWQTPPYTPQRFDARYYAMWLPPGQQPDILPDSELTQGVWLTPEQALHRHSLGELFITYPALETLRVMQAAGQDLAQASGRMQARGEAPYPHAGGEMLAGVHIVPGRTPTLPPATHTNTYVLGGKDLVVVDPATPYADEQEALLRYLDLLQERGGKLREIWLTHHHHDHIGSVPLVAERYGVPVAAHPLTAEAVDFPVQRHLADGDEQTLDLGGGQTATWRALHTPGHTRGHICFYETRLKTVLSGDLVLGHGSVLVAPPEGNMQAYLTSVARLQGMSLGFIFPAHGPPVAAAQKKLREYVEHRLGRESAIIQAMGHDVLTPRDIVPRVYTDVPESAWPLAELNVMAHLEKLVAEGRVLMRDGSYQLSTAT